MEQRINVLSLLHIIIVGNTIGVDLTLTEVILH